MQRDDLLTTDYRGIETALENIEANVYALLDNPKVRNHAAGDELEEALSHIEAARADADRGRRLTQ